MFHLKKNENLPFATTWIDLEGILLGEISQSKKRKEVAQSCLTLCNPMDCSSPGSSVHGIYQARVLEWGAIAFSEVLVNRWMETEDVTHTHTHARAIERPF